MRHVIPTSLVALALLACREAPTTGPAAVAAKAAGGEGPIIRQYPREVPGPRYYALLAGDFMPTDGGWVGIVFIRSPGCVPAGFNLLNQFDPTPTPWGCALTVEGEARWRALSDPFPFQIRERPLGAVPVYFVALSELQAASVDGLLTIGELQSLPSLLVGYADFLEHVVHNTTQPTNHGHETLVARGELTDGRTFQFRYNEKFLPETGEHVFQNVKISFE